MRYRGRVPDDRAAPPDAASGALLGGRLASARADARRITDELASRGLASPDEAARLAAAVDRAAERAERLVGDALREALRVLGALGELRGDVPSLDALAARVERLEAALPGLAGADREPCDVRS